MEIEKLKIELQNYIKDKERYEHSLGTMKMAGILADRYEINKEDVMKAALMHDMAKEIVGGEALKYIEENNIEITEIERYNTKLLHGKIGADICKKKFQFNEDMCNGVRWHTTGRANMSMLEKIIFCADKVEENRKYNDVEYYRQLSINDINKAILEIINFTLKDNIEKGKLLLEKSIETRNYILINVKK